MAQGVGRTKEKVKALLITIVLTLLSIVGPVYVYRDHVASDLETETLPVVLQLGVEWFYGASMMLLYTVVLLVMIIVAIGFPCAVYAIVYRMLNAEGVEKWGS